MILLAFAANISAQEPNINGSELWEKVITYHDPKGIWEKFSGKVHLISVHANSNIYDEEFEVQKEQDLYQAKRFAKDVIAIRGIKNGKCFNSVNGDNSPTDEDVKKYNLSCEDTKMYKEHHTCHIGLPMELKISGVQVQDEVEMVEFQGKDRLALKFIGYADKVKHPYYAGEWTLFIDPNTFAMKGMDFKSPDWNVYFIAYGEIEVNGIKMPMVKNYFNSNDDSHRFTDNFTLVK